MHLQRKLEKRYPNSPKAHQSVADDLQDLEPRLGQALKHLKLMRQKADYDTRMRKLMQKTKLCVLRSSQIRTDLTGSK